MLSSVINFIKRLFSKPTPIPPTYIIPHPEESKNNNQTSANVDIQGILLTWFTRWYVPFSSWSIFNGKVVVKVYDSWTQDIYNTWPSIKPETPAFTVNGSLYILAPWLNPGVIAHEEAHISYSFLTNAEKEEFKLAYNEVIVSDPLVKYLFTINAYGLSSVIEGHAEIYRYLGEQMPYKLKRFYPKLF